MIHSTMPAWHRRLLSKSSSLTSHIDRVTHANVFRDLYVDTDTHTHHTSSESCVHTKFMLYCPSVSLGLVLPVLLALYHLCLLLLGHDGEMGEHPRPTILCFGAYIILEVHVLKFGLQLVALLESDRTYLPE